MQSIGRMYFATSPRSIYHRSLRVPTNDGGVNHKSEGVAELKFWNFNVPYKAYMALTNVKTLQLWKFCNTLYLIRLISY